MQYSIKEDHRTNSYKKELSMMQDNFEACEKKLRSNPFGVFGGSPAHRRANNFGIPLEKISE